MLWYLVTAVRKLKDIVCGDFYLDNLAGNFEPPALFVEIPVRSLVYQRLVNQVNVKRNGLTTHLAVENNYIKRELMITLCCSLLKSPIRYKYMAVFLPQSGCWYCWSLLSVKSSHAEMPPGLEHSSLSAEGSSRVYLALHHPINTEVIHLTRIYFTR